MLFLVPPQWRTSCIRVYRLKSPAFWLRLNYRLIGRGWSLLGFWALVASLGIVCWLLGHTAAALLIGWWAAFLAVALMVLLLRELGRHAPEAHGTLRLL